MNRHRNESGISKKPRRRTLEDKSLVMAHIDMEVPFQDIDPAEIVWHGNYFRYFEIARTALWRQIDYDYPQMRESGYVWPLSDAHAHFVQALTYGQKVTVHAGLTEWYNRMRIDYAIVDTLTGKRLTTGYTVHCAVLLATWELQLASPAALLDRLEKYL